MRLLAEINDTQLGAKIFNERRRFNGPVRGTVELDAEIPGPRRVNARINERTVTPANGQAALFISPNDYLEAPLFRIYTHTGVLYNIGTAANSEGHNLLGFPYPEIPLVRVNSQNATVAPNASGFYLRPGAPTPAPTVVIPTDAPPHYLSPLDGLPYDLYLANYAVIYGDAAPVHADLDASRVGFFGTLYGATRALQLAVAAGAPAAIHQGIYYWPALVGSLTYLPSGGLISATDPALLESSSPILSASAGLKLHLSADYPAQSSNFSGPPWITDQITEQFDAWHTGALHQRLLNLGNTTVQLETQYDSQKIYNWIVNNV